MAKRIYSISIRWVETTMATKLIDDALDQLDDWLRLDGYQWYCSTDLNEKQIHEIISPLLKRKDSFVIAAIDSTAIWGHASNTVWNWFGKNGATVTGKRET